MRLKRLLLGLPVREEALAAEDVAAPRLHSVRRRLEADRARLQLCTHLFSPLSLFLSPALLLASLRDDPVEKHGGHLGSWP